MKRIVLGSLVSSLAMAGAFLLAPAEAEACGGTFCDGGPQPMPVDQSGENILFVRDGDFIEAHIQIQYEGEAERFGWVIPMQSVPEFSVGSDPLFQSLLNGLGPDLLHAEHVPTTAASATRATTEPTTAAAPVVRRATAATTTTTGKVPTSWCRRRSVRSRSPCSRATTPRRWSTG